MKLKDSNVTYIGKIPFNWEVTKYKRFAKSGMGTTILKEDLEDDGYPVYSATESEEIFGYLKNPKIILNPGDLIIPARGTIGYVKLVNKYCTSTQTTIYSRIQGINNEFLFYQAIGLKDWWFEYDKTAVPQITVQQVQNNPLLLPPEDIQRQIVSKLDFKIKRIDGLIKNQQQQIEKLKEYKQSLISFYIDKYIYDLQEHKGRINRDAIPLNYIANIIRGNTPFKKDELLDEGVYVGVQYGKTYKTEIIDENYNFFVDSKFFKEDQIVNNGDVIFISTSETIEDLGHACFYNRNELGLLGGEQFVFKPNKEKTNGKFLYYCAVEFSKYIKKYSTGLKVYRYNLTHLKNIHINLPSIDIQESIVKQLDKNILAINSILGIKQKKIDKLNEYKKSLIYEYVTGKKEVA